MRALTERGGEFRLALHFGRSGGWETRQCGPCREAGNDYILGCLKYHGGGKCECPNHQKSAVGETPSWRAVYRTDDGKVTWDVDVESLACPVSVITPESLTEVRRFSEARRAVKLGGVLYGPDSSRWSARWYDTAVLLQYEIEREEAAMHKAMRARQT